MKEDELIAELNDALGVQLKRRASRIVGLPGYHVEVASCTPAKLAQAWTRTVTCDELEIPVLFYRLPRKPYRALMSLSDITGGYRCEELEYTVEMSVAGFTLMFHARNLQQLREVVRGGRYATLQ